VVKDYVDERIGGLRRDVEGRISSIESKQAADLARFEAIGKKVEDRGRATDQRIDDHREAIREQIKGLETRTREDIHQLEGKIDSRHTETMGLLNEIAGKTGVVGATSSGVWSRLPPILKVLIVTGVIIGTATAAFISSLSGVFQ